MIHYRPFLNSDPPGIAEIWRNQPPVNAFMQPMTPAVLDDTVFAKPYFDRDGLIVAVEDDKPVGFVHAGFGPTESLAELDYSKGTTAMLLVLPREDRSAIARELLARSEVYLQAKGATTLFGGATQDLAPYYFGLYGGSLLSGVMASDHEGGEVFRSAGYVASTYARVMRRDLSAFRPPIDRELMQVRRQYQLVKQTETLAESWWESSAYAAIERAEFVLLPKTSGPPAAVGKYWDVQPLSGAWGVRAVGIVSLDVDEQPSANRSAIATHFISETLKQIQSFGMMLAEFHVRTDDSLLSDVCAKLAFDESDQGLLFKK